MPLSKLMAQAIITGPAVSVSWLLVQALYACPSGTKVGCLALSQPSLCHIFISGNLEKGICGGESSISLVGVSLEAHQLNVAGPYPHG